jgi:hypothetical protein
MPIRLRRVAASAMATTERIDAGAHRCLTASELSLDTDARL